MKTLIARWLGYALSLGLLAFLLAVMVAGTLYGAMSEEKQ